MYVLFLLAIVLSVLRFTDSDDPFGIFQLFFYNCTNLAKYKYHSSQRIVGIIMMTVINRQYCIQYQPRKIVTLQYHDNRETLFLTHIDSGFLYYLLDEQFRSRYILTAGSCIIF